jgi:protoporphyrinogen oxidase/cytochrome b involved in lipid metabolism
MKTSHNIIYDTIIIGCGISGLYIANNLKDKNYILFDKRDRVGGRIISVNHKNLIYDAGAVRIQNNHKKLLKLIKSLDLEHDLLEMDCKHDYYLRTKHKNYSYKGIKHTLDSNFINHGIYDKLYKDVNRLKINKNNFTPYQICNQLYTSEHAQLLKDVYGYDKEIQNGNLITFFQNHGKKDSTFYIMKNGLSQIINKLYNEINEKVFLEHTLLDYEFINNKFKLKIMYKNKIKNYSCKKLILAIPPEYLNKIKSLDSIENIINTVDSTNYIRIFAIYPKINNKYWYEGICNITTDSYIRKIIPYNKKDGIIQICYCDGNNAEYWNNIMLYDNLKEKIQEELKKIFPNKNIPQPTYLTGHYWKKGTYYWKTGTDSNFVGGKILKPFNNELYISGDSYSNNQGWSEGALETSDKIIKCINKKINCTIKVHDHKLKYFSVSDVKKHNKIYDGWMIYKDNVYNVTSFIKKHPGALAIKKGLGKDATAIFDGVGHSDRARRIMNKYLIGKIRK